jgi:hypothetical protein
VADPAVKQVAIAQLRGVDGELALDLAFGPFITLGAHGHKRLGANISGIEMRSAFWGPGIDAQEVAAFLADIGAALLAWADTAVITL